MSVHLVVPAELAGHVAVGLELLRQRLREQSIEYPADAETLRLEALSVHRVSFPDKTEVVADAAVVAEPPFLLSYADTARLLDCSTSTVKRLVESGVLEPVRLSANGRPRISRAALEEFIASLDGGTFRDRVRSKTAPVDSPASAALSAGAFPGATPSANGAGPGAPPQEPR